jgi:hypothetical protein
MKSLCFKSLLALTLLSSFSAFANDDVVLICNPVEGSRLVQVSINCLANGSDCLFISRKQSARRMDNVSLQLLSAGHGLITLGNSTSNIRVVMTTEAPSSATVYNSNGFLANCSEQ